MKLLVTRPAIDADGTARRVVEAGHEAVLAPVTAIVGTGTEPDPDQVDAVLVTSANALRHLSAASRARLLTVPLLCVGAKTAAVGRTLGFQSVHAADGDGRALVALIAARFPPSARLLYLTGTPRKPHVERDLATLGFHLNVTELYQTRPVEDWPGAHHAACAACSMALHFSRASVEALLHAAAKADLMPTLAAMTHLRLSEDVATPLRKAGMTQIAIAPQASESALLSLLHIKET